MRRRSSPTSYSRRVRNSSPSTAGAWKRTANGDALRRRPGAPGGRRSSCTRGQMVTSSWPPTTQLRRARPNGSVTVNVAGPSVKRPRRFVGTRYAARAVCPPFSAGIRKRAARRPSSKTSVRSSWGESIEPGSSTVRSTRASPPTWTRLGRTVRSTRTTRVRLRTHTQARIRRLSVTTPRMVSSSAPSSRPASRSPDAAPVRVQPRRVSAAPVGTPTPGRWPRGPRPSPGRRRARRPESGHAAPRRGSAGGGAPGRPGRPA